MLFIRVQARGKITAIGNPAYSIIQVNGLSGLNNYTMQRALTSMREYDAAFEVDIGNVVLSGVDSSSLYIQFQRVGGTGVNNWKTTNSFYIDVSAMIVL